MCLAHQSVTMFRNAALEPEMGQRHGAPEPYLSASKASISAFEGFLFQLLPRSVCSCTRRDTPA